jgi:quinoprotein glucose dehydrogenase
MSTTNLLMKRFKERITTFGGWLTLVMGLTVLLCGLPMLAIGPKLIALEGSWYYAIAGAVFTVAAIQILRERRSGYWLYVAAFGVTIVWSFWEVGPDPWGLLPRLLTFAVIQIVCWALWRWIDPRLTPAFSPTDWWDGIGGAIVGIAAVFVLSLMLFRGPAPTSDVADVITAGPSVGGSVRATQASDIPDGSWPNYGRGPGGERFSPLSDITTANVKNLKRAWVYHTGALPGATEISSQRFMFEATPLIARGKLVACTPHAQVIAVDPVSGNESWRFDAPGGVDHAPFLACRGVAYDETPNTTGSCAHRLLFATLTARMYALDVETGKRCTGFGNDGEIDLTWGSQVFSTQSRRGAICK